MRRSTLTVEQAKALVRYDLGAVDAADAEFVTFEPGEVLLREGMPMESLLLVTRGTAKVCVAADSGRDLALCRYVSEGILGDVELMTDSLTATTTVIAMTPFDCVALPYRKYARILRQDVAFLNRVGRELALKLTRSSQSYALSALHAGEERLCGYILQTASRSVFRETLTEVSAALGLSYRHLLRLLKKLCQEGTLEKAEGGYRIRDANALRVKARQE